jgi:hypothetical protein
MLHIIRQLWCNCDLSPIKFMKTIMKTWCSSIFLFCFLWPKVNFTIALTFELYVKWSESDSGLFSLIQLFLVSSSDWRLAIKEDYLQFKFKPLLFISTVIVLFTWNICFNKTFDCFAFSCFECLETYHQITGLGILDKIYAK